MTGKGCEMHLYVCGGGGGGVAEWGVYLSVRIHLGEEVPARACIALPMREQ